MPIKLLFLLTGLLLTNLAAAEERILSFHSDIQIAADSSMTVTETIDVRAERDRIKRGIYREFPTRYWDRYGNVYQVAFKVVRVLRDGKPEPFSTRARSNGVRLYIGNPDRRLPTGNYRYSITYETNRQLGYFEDHDELYWNVNGNGWDFPVDSVSATVRLPGQVAANDMAIEGYTGAQGSRARDYEASISPDGVVSIRTSRPLGARQGLTLVASWPKGVVPEPSQLDRVTWLLEDNLGVVMAIVTALVCSVYLYLVWNAYGRDPKKGVIFPHYEVPEGYSPASVRYIQQMGYDNTALSAAVINLAVKGHLRIVEEDGKYTLHRESSDAKMAPGEAAVLQHLLGTREQLELDNKNYQIVLWARSAHRRALRRDYLGQYFAKNSALLVPSFIFAGVMLALTLAQSAMNVLVWVLFILIGALHFLYGFLLKAPTPKGRQRMDQFEGFKMYMEVAEKDDLNRGEAPDLTMELFERFLPYAVALDVEQAWAERFTGVLASMKDQEYKPTWYTGLHVSPRSLGSFSSSVGSSFSSAISSSASPPGSGSGGGGGGFSGGGGGGGGGGW